MPETQSFYRPVDIGSLHLGGNLFLAPVAGYSDRAFRSVCRLGGADFAYTEMVSAEALVRGSDKTALIMERAPGETSSEEPLTKRPMPYRFSAATAKPSPKPPASYTSG